MPIQHLLASKLIKEIKKQKENEITPDVNSENTDLS